MTSTTTNTETLPEMCYVRHITTGETVMIRRGEMGHLPCRAWAECENDAERLDVHNGLLLSALWDAAFDRALVTFDDQGRPEFSPSLSKQAHSELRWRSPIPLTEEHRCRLARHRDRARALS